MTSLSEQLQALAPRVEERAHTILQDLADTIAPAAQISPLLQVAHSSLEEGKRFRAFLAFVGGSVANHSPLQTLNLDDLGAALELYQASALVHDDIIDHAPTRRGRPSAHAAFAAHHRSALSRGDSEDFGISSAILAGDLLFSAAELAMIRQCEAIPHYRDGVMELYAQMHAEVAIGQFLDIAAEQRPLNVNDSQAINAQTADTDSLRMILSPWGHAFQLRDDDLGIFGDPRVTGKSAGDDLREGKRTYLLALTWQEANVSEREKLAHGLGNPELSENELEELRAIVKRRGRRRHEEVISTFEAEGFLALESSNFNANQRELLSEVATMLIKRSK